MKKTKFLIKKLTNYHCLLIFSFEYSLFILRMNFKKKFLIFVSFYKIIYYNKLNNIFRRKNEEALGRPFQKRN